MCVCVREREREKERERRRELVRALARDVAPKINGPVFYVRVCACVQTTLFGRGLAVREGI